MKTNDKRLCDIVRLKLPCGSCVLPSSRRSRRLAPAGLEGQGKGVRGWGPGAHRRVKRERKAGLHPFKSWAAMQRQPISGTGFDFPGCPGIDTFIPVL